MKKIISLLLIVCMLSALLCQVSVFATDYEVVKEPWLDSVSKSEVVDAGDWQYTRDYYHTPMPFINGKSTVYVDQIDVPGEWVSYFCSGYYEVDTKGNISELKTDIKNSEFGYEKIYGVVDFDYNDTEIFLDYYYNNPEQYGIKIEEFNSKKYYGGFYVDSYDQISGVHKELYVYVNGYAKASESEESEYYGMIDTNDNVILPFVYEYVGSVSNDGYVWVRKDNKWGIIKLTGGEVVPSTEKSEIVLTIGEKKADIFGEIKENDVATKIVNGRTMLPIRFIAEALGAEVEWDGAERKVTITKDDIEIIITIDSNKAIVSGKTITLDSPAFVENNRTYLPLRFVSENLGAKVEWVENTRQVIITKPNK